MDNNHNSSSSFNSPKCSNCGSQTGWDHIKVTGPDRTHVFCNNGKCSSGPLTPKQPGIHTPKDPKGRVPGLPDNPYKESSVHQGNQWNPNVKDENPKPKPKPNVKPEGHPYEPKTRPYESPDNWNPNVKDENPKPKPKPNVKPEGNDPYGPKPRPYEGPNNFGPKKEDKYKNPPKGPKGGDDDKNPPAGGVQPLKPKPKKPSGSGAQSLKPKPMGPAKAKPGYR